MELNELLRDDQAVSQVIGVVLMVAITVLLAATAASFFLGLTNEQQTTTPKVAIGFDYDGTSTPPYEDRLKVIHKSGDPVPASQIEVVVSGAAVPGDVVDKRYTWAELASGPSGDVSAGMTVTISRKSLKDPSGPATYSELSLRDATVEVIWTDPASGQSYVLGSWNGA